MSQEQPHIRSRRELRQARDASQGSVPRGREHLSAATELPAAGPERSSQIRARDRAALRAIKELEEKEEQLSAGGPPTRRQLRLQQLKEQALTSALPVQPAPAAPPSLTAPSSLTGPPSSTVHPSAVAPLASTGRRPAAGAGDGAASDNAALPEGISVERALAARALIAEQAKNQIAKMEHIASLDPEIVDPEILAEQIALAERAAVLNRRARAKQKLAEQAGAAPGTVQAPDDAEPGPRPPVPGKQEHSKQESSGPATANNLAMVTPLEFVQVPGVDRPVMKPPATSHVPLVTRPGSKVQEPGTKRRRAAGSGGPADAGTGPSDPAPGRSRVIARAEAAAKAAAPSQSLLDGGSQQGDALEELPRVPARSAYGLDPLDAATAGLGRAQRVRILQISVVALGVLALITGIFLIISGMSR